MQDRPPVDGPLPFRLVGRHGAPTETGSRRRKRQTIDNRCQWLRLAARDESPSYFGGGKLKEASQPAAAGNSALSQ